MNIFISQALQGDLFDTVVAVLIFTACLIIPYIILLYFSPSYIKFRKGAELLRNEKFSEAKDIYSEILNKKPNLYSAFLNRAIAEACLNETDNAINDIQNYLKKGSNYRAYAVISELYFKMKNYDLAFHYINKAILMRLPKKKKDLFYLNRGVIHSKLKEHYEAINDYSIVLSNNPDHAGANNNIGFSLTQTGEFKKALHYLNKAIELDPQFAFAYNNRGFVYANLGNLDKAFEDYEKSYELDNNNAYLFRNRGLTYLMKGKYSLSIGELEKAVSMESEFESDLLPKIEEAKNKMN